MVEHGHIVHYSGSPVVWTHFWQPVHEASLPNEREVAWAFCPDIGNEDEGYGLVVLARLMPKCLMMGPGLEWRDMADRPINPVFWAVVREPEGFIARPAAEEAMASAEKDRQNVVNRTGPFAHHAKGGPTMTIRITNTTDKPQTVLVEHMVGSDDVTLSIAGAASPTDEQRRLLMAEREAILGELRDYANGWGTSPSHPEKGAFAAVVLRQFGEWIASRGVDQLPLSPTALREENARLRARNACLRACLDRVWPVLFNAGRDDAAKMVEAALAEGHP